MELQQQRLKVPARPGVAYPLVHKLLAFNTETRGVRNDPSNRETAESRIALATDALCEALAKSPGN